jgi:hypothetical protein
MLYLRLRLLLLTLLFAGSSACTTPSVTIPPPSPEDIVFALDADAGEVSFSFDPAPSFGNAVVYVFNRDAGVGVITVAENDGSVGATRPFAAVEGDEVVVTFEVVDQLASTCVRVADGRSSSANECNP